MNILNLYAGVGGNARRWGLEHTIHAVERDQRIADIYVENLPHHNVFVRDANDFLYQNGADYDFIWSSPPCQSHTQMVKATGRKSQHGRIVDMTLYQQIIWLQHFCKDVLWVVENVKPYYGILRPKGVYVAEVGRHVFWSNFYLGEIRDVPRPPGFINKGTLADMRVLQEWLGINYEKPVLYENNHCPVQILRNAVHPDIGLQILLRAEQVLTPEPNLL